MTLQKRIELQEKQETKRQSQELSKAFKAVEDLHRSLNRLKGYKPGDLSKAYEKIKCCQVK